MTNIARRADRVRRRRRPRSTSTGSGPGFGAEVHGVDLATADDAGRRGPAGAGRAQGAVLPPASSLDRRRPGRPRHRLGELTAGHPVAPASTRPTRRSTRIDSADPGSPSPTSGTPTSPSWSAPPLGLDPARRDAARRTAATRAGPTPSSPTTSLSAPVRRLVDAADRGARRQPRVGRLPAAPRRATATLWEGERSPSLDPVEHPVVRVHPETGRKGAVRQPGLHLATSSGSPTPRAAASSTCSTPTSPSPSTPSGTAGGPATSAIWDNRATAHYANRDYGDARRVMHRITLRGDEPVGVDALR